MFEPLNNPIEYSAIIIIVVFLIREMFGYLKDKKHNGHSDLHQIKTDIALMQQQLTNHMTEYDKCITRTEKMVIKNSDSIDEIRSALVRIDAKLE